MQQPLSILTEPRRPPSDTTGQLRHLLRRGLVVRVSKGVYDVVRSDRHQAFTLDRAKQLRANAGALRPTEMPTLVGGTGAMRGA
jgi:hypothetical protein